MSDWRVLAEQKRLDYLRSLEANAPKLNYQAEARGYSWTYIGTAITSIPDAVYPFCRKSDQWVRSYTNGELKLVWIIDLYKTPDKDSGAGEMVKFGHHGVARKTEEGKAQFILEGAPHKLWYQWTGEKDKNKARDLPGAYVQFDSSRVEKLVRANWRDWTKEDLKRLALDLDPDTYDREQEKREQENREREAYLQKYANKRLERVSENDLRDYMLGRSLEHNRLTPRKIYSK